MRKVFRTRRRKVVAGIVVLALIVASAALAAWLVSSSGRAAGKGAQLVAPTFVAASDSEINSSGDLLPGGTGSLWVKVSNSNTIPLYASVARQNPTVGYVITSSDPAACAGSNVTFTPSAGPVTFTAADNAADALQVPAGAVGQLVRLPRLLSLSEAAPNGCQSVYFEVSGEFGPNALAIDFSTAAP